MVFVQTCRWSLSSARTVDHKWSQQSRTCADTKAHTITHQVLISTWKGPAKHNYSEAILLLSYYWRLVSPLAYSVVRLNYWWGHLYRVKRRVKNTLVMWKMRYTLSWKISRSLTRASCQLCWVKQLSPKSRKKVASALTQLLVAYCE